MAMDNCPRCGKLFNKIPGVKQCDACRKQIEEDFELCYKYLRDTPNSTVPEVSEATGVDERQILDFYRTGRLLTGDSGYPCARCGKPATRGKYCGPCADSLSKGFAGTEFGGAKPVSQAPPPDEHRERKDFSHKLRVDRT